ncbi:MAG: NAD-dependent epimerase/dehydratase family protein [Candidatus Bathyarchaeota archaeon]|nr:NAD-dependent epimerase/dehydratase family protein [Candidatus Bathyarchaeota archaeon]
MACKKIFLPGGNGFLGSSVAKKLKEKKLSFVSMSSRNGIDFREFEPTKNLFEKEKFDAVINCAAFVGGIQFGYTRPGEIFFNNVSMCTNLMEASRLTGVKRFVNPLSNCTYPEHLTELKEDEWWNGPLHETVLAYGAARKASWAQSWAYHQQYSFKTVNLILPNMFGIGDHFDEVRSHALGALIAKFVEAKRRNLPRVTVWGTGKPIREWLYVEDGAEALVRALDIDPVVDPINVGVGKGISTLELAEMIKGIVGYEGAITLDPSKPDGAPCKIMSVAKMKQIFNWEPQTSLRAGIKKTVEWYLEEYR